MIHLEYNYDKLFDLKGQEPYTFNNWKDVMRYIDAPDNLEGNSKLKMIKNFERFVEYTKNGYQIVVTRVKNSADPCKNNKGSKYRKYTVPLMKSILSEKEEMDFSIGSLARELGCINKYYQQANYHKKKTARDLGIEPQIVYDFFTNIHSKIKNIVVGTLDNMVNTGYIQYITYHRGKLASKDNKLSLSYDEEKDENIVKDHSVVIEEFIDLTPEQDKEYEEIKQELFEEFDINNESELFSKRKNHTEFYKELNKRMFDRTHIQFVYDNYHIQKLKDCPPLSDAMQIMYMLKINFLVCTSFQNSVTEKFKKKLSMIKMGKIIIEDKNEKINKRNLQSYERVIEEIAKRDNIFKLMDEYIFIMKDLLIEE